MKKIWMNIRLPLINKFEIVDKKYEEIMIKLEEKDKRLPSNFRIQGY